MRGAVIVKWRQFAHCYVSLAFRRPWTILFALLLVSGLFGGASVLKMRVVTDLEALLPRGTPSVRALAESRHRIGSTDFFVIAAASAEKDAQGVAAIQDALKARIEAEWQDATWVQVDRDTTFFKDRALYFFTEEKLTELKQILNDEIVRVSAEDLPGMVNLTDTRQAGIGGIEARLSEWLDADALAGMGFPPQIEEALSRFFSIGSKKNEAVPETAKAIPENLRDRLISPDGGVGVVFVQLDKPATDFDYAKFALARGSALIDEVLSADGRGDLTAQVVGAYRSFTEVDQVAADGEIATAVSAGLVLLLLLLFFRSIPLTLALFVTLAAAGSMTMGIAALLFGRLTVFTVFVLALLAGMGIDYGIHLLGRIRSERERGLPLQAAVETAVSDTGSSLLVAAMTTVGCLLVLLVGHFDGFREFAIIAAIGVTLSLVFAIATIPPLCALLFRNARRAPLSVVARENPRWFARAAAGAFAAALAVTLGLSFFVPRVEFEHDFRNLRGAKTSRTIGYGAAVGKKAGTAPSIILGADRRQMEAVHGYLLQRLGKDPRLGSFITAATFVPPFEDQNRRRVIIQEIGEIANRRALNRVTGEAADWVQTLRTMCRAEPFGDRDIPEWTRKLLTEKDGTFGAVGHFYAKINDWDANAILDYQDDYGALSIAGKPVLMANSAFILSDVVRMVRSDSGRLLVVSAAVLALILGLFAKSLRGALVLLLTVGASIVWTFGMSGLFHVRIGLYNLIVIPVILGVSIDTAVHLYHRHLTLGPKRLLENLRTTGGMTAASTWTTLAGFTGLLFVSHLGLRSIGILGCVGIAASWCAAMLLLPFLLTRFVPVTCVEGDTRVSQNFTPSVSTRTHASVSS